MKGIGWAAVQKIPCKSLIKLYEAKSNRAPRRESSSPAGRAAEPLTPLGLGQRSLGSPWAGPCAQQGRDGSAGLPAASASCRGSLTAGQLLPVESRDLPAPSMWTAGISQLLAAAPQLGQDFRHFRAVTEVTPRAV